MYPLVTSLGCGDRYTSLTQGSQMHAQMKFWCALTFSGTMLHSVVLAGLQLKANLLSRPPSAGNAGVHHQGQLGLLCSYVLECKAVKQMRLLREHQEASVPGAWVA